MWVSMIVPSVEQEGSALRGLLALATSPAPNAEALKAPTKSRRVMLLFFMIPIPLPKT
jgi:hypothetical protein